MKVLIIFSFISTLSTFPSFGQNTTPTKRELLAAFKNSIRQNKKLHTTSNTWVICNKDSSFFKSDTIWLINNENYYYYSNGCCNFIDWTFYKRNKFIQDAIEICKEPTSAKVITINDYYTIKLVKSNHDLIMTVTNRINLTEKYKVLSLAKTKIGKEQNMTNAITLLRIK